MKDNSRLFIIFMLMGMFINTGIIAQNAYHGSWIIPTSIYIDYDNIEAPHVNLENRNILLFNNQGLISVTKISDDNTEHRNSPYSAGAYLENGNPNFFMLERNLYYQGNEYQWLNWSGGDIYHFKTDFCITPKVGANNTTYTAYYSYYNPQKDFDAEFHFIDISTDANGINIGSIKEFSCNDCQENGHYSSAFAISKLNADNERNLYWCGYDGLRRKTIDANTDDNDPWDETLLDFNDLDAIDFTAYNLELKHNDNEDEDPTIAWITNPRNNLGTSSNIYFYYDGTASIIATNLGIIGGIEFSKKDDNILYVSSQDEGIVAVDWQSSIQTNNLVINESLTPSIDDDFTHTYLQTAPDGNIYAVSDDGFRLGQISMDPNGNGAFDPDYYVFYDENADRIIGTYRLINIDGVLTLYFTLPENEDVFYGLYAYIPIGGGVNCHQCDATVNIQVLGGVPNYSLIVSNGENQHYTDHFTYNATTQVFSGSNLCEGTYYYTISDNDNPSKSYSSTFIIEDLNAYDFADEMLVIDKEEDLPHGLSDMIWDASDEFIEQGSILFEKGFKIINNTTITVNNLNLKFDRNASIYIEPGSKLILNNSVLTNYDCEVEYMWNGVFVEGISSAEQTDENMGVLEMNASTIEFAKTAVTLNDANLAGRGGIIRAEDSYFKNNRQGVLFNPYHNIKHFPGGDVELNNASYFRYCTFVNNGDYLENADSFTKFIRLWDVKGIRIKKCDFNSGGQNGIAIDALDAGFNVSGYCENGGGNGCTPEQWERSEFIGFDKAISANNTQFARLYPINIQHSYFYNNNYGAYLYGLQNVVSVKTSEFIVGNNGETKEKALCGSFWGRGIHIEASNGFTIENNVFSKNTGAELDDEVIGIHARENPSEHDIIYNNTFTNLKIANQAFGNNRQDGNDPWGIEYQCNENTNNKIDFEVIGDQVTNSKIHPNMGFINISAHNKFTSTSFADLEWHWRNMGMEQENYYLHSTELGTAYEPHDNYIETTNNYPTLFVKQVASVINQCPDNDGIHQERTVLTPEEQQDLETEFAMAYNDYQSVETIYNDLKDGGNTEGTSLTIASAQAGDTWELRDNLLGKSPYLSHEVLQEAANRTDVLPNSILLDILAANPDELKKEDFIQYLENKEEPLPDYMIDILRELSTGTTYKTVLLNQMALHKRKQIQATNRIIKSLINEEEQDFVAIKNWLANKFSLRADMQIAGIFTNEGNYTDAIALLDLIPETYNLQGDALNLYLDNKDYMLMEIDLKQNNRSYMDLTSDEIAQLEIWADGEKGMARSSSRIILEYFYGHDNYCDCMDRGGNKSANADDTFEKQESPLSIEASPNPATHYVEFTYELSEIDTEGIIIITDINGKQIQSFTVKYSKGVQAWDTRKIPSGSYIYTLKTKYFKESGKLIIQ